MSKTFKLKSLFIKFQLPSKTEQTLKPNPQAMSIQNIFTVSLINSCMENSLSDSSSIIIILIILLINSMLC